MRGVISVGGCGGYQWFYYVVKKCRLGDSHLPGLVECESGVPLSIAELFSGL